MVADTCRGMQVVAGKFGRMLVLEGKTAAGRTEKKQPSAQSIQWPNFGDLIQFAASIKLCAAL